MFANGVWSIFNVLTTPNAGRGSTGDNGRQVGVIVDVGVTHSASKKTDCAIGSCRHVRLMLPALISDMQTKT